VTAAASGRPDGPGDRAAGVSGGPAAADSLARAARHGIHLLAIPTPFLVGGAEVAGLDVLGRYLEDFDHSAADDDEFAQAMMRKHGVPGELAGALGAAVAAFRRSDQAGG